MNSKEMVERLGFWINPKRREQARLASFYFLRASVRYPASITAQAVSIAIACMEKDQTPQDLYRAIEREEGEIHELVKKAKAAHKAKGKGLKDPSYFNVKRIISADFRIAQDLMDLKQVQLEELERCYNDRRSEGLDYWEVESAVSKKASAMTGKGLKNLGGIIPPKP